MTADYQGLTPPPELVQRWRNAAPPLGLNRESWIATAAARWGSDQELEACCADLRMVLGPNQADWLRSVRRPKPPSLAEEALAELEVLSNYAHELLSNCAHDLGCSESVIRRALERLQELEGGNG